MSQTVPALLIWSANSGQLQQSLYGHTAAIDNLLFSPDGQILVSASYNGEIRIWGIRP